MLLVNKYVIFFLNHLPQIGDAKTENIRYFPVVGLTKPLFGACRTPLPVWQAGLRP